MRLPEAFQERMRLLLKEDSAAFFASYGEPPAAGLRVNPLKITPEQLDEMRLPFVGGRVPWNRLGFYCLPGSRPALHAFHAAGLFYLQEPSAMAPAACLSVRPGERVLDLCAAPGGKSTQLAADLSGRGLLVANDYSASRARALVRNLERFGIRNACVTAEEPARLAEAFGPFFDKVLVDAPCSGEGMFRRDPALVKSWEERGPAYYVPLQRRILREAVRLLRPGGRLLYSTCTFSEEEDEGAVRWLLETEPEMSLLPLVPAPSAGGSAPIAPALTAPNPAAPPVAGACPGTGGEPVLRLYPNRVRGEGHFLALFEKKAAAPAFRNPEKNGIIKKVPEKVLTQSGFSGFSAGMSEKPDAGSLLLAGGRLYELPEQFPAGIRLRFLRTGLFLGYLKNGRFSPSQAAAMALSAAAYTPSFSMRVTDERVQRYLKGETLALTERESAALRTTAGKSPFILVCADGHALGWAKLSGQSLKNRLDPDWRLM